MMKLLFNMKKIYQHNYDFRAIVIFSFFALLTSCSDTWDDHYQGLSNAENKSLLQMIEENENLSDFLKVLQNTHLYNNNHRTEITYADLLNDDQSLTVWAPTNGTFDVEDLLKQCRTTKGDSIVGQHFSGNHIAHTLIRSNNASWQQDPMNHINLFNNKYLYVKDIPSLASIDIPANNGLLNISSSIVPYTYNVYEGLTSLSEASHIGSFLKTYERFKLDEEASIQRGIEDGKKVYSDSVLITENNLFRMFGKINSEDSTYLALLPSSDTWDDVLDEAKPYFFYGTGEVADSISNYWKNLLLMQDLFFNLNEQVSIADSIKSTNYSKFTPEYNVFYRPLDKGGILDPDNIEKELECSNGSIMYLKSWPFTKEQLYFRPVKVEGEREANIIQNNECTFNYRTVYDSKISNDGYLDIVPRNNANWTATFEVANTLAGTYDICLVLLPKTVSNPYSRDFKPNKFTAVLNYVDKDGNKSSVNFDEELTNNGETIDTVKIGRFALPTCNYGQQNVTVSLQIKCSIQSRQTKDYSREMYLDCIYLKPVSEGKENEL